MKKNVIMSINIAYAKKILAGTKRYEFRKNNMDIQNIDKVYIYMTAPIKKIVGYFTIKSKIVSDVDYICNYTRGEGGISEEALRTYFRDKGNKCIAYEIDQVVEFDERIDPYKEIEGFVAPMSFILTDFNHENIKRK